MKRARILYDILKQIHKEGDLMEVMSTDCPGDYAMSDFKICKYKSTGIADSYECLQCWMCKERDYDNRRNA